MNLLWLAGLETSAKICSVGLALVDYPLRSAQCRHRPFSSEAVACLGENWFSWETVLG